MEEVHIRTLEKKGQDERGFVQEWKFADGRQITILKRKKDGHFGHHSHTGKDPAKDPERFFVLEGRVRITWWDVRGAAHQKEMTGGDEVEIPKDVPHCFDALEDCWFLEYRTTHFDPANVDVVDLPPGLCAHVIKRTYDAE
jgi:hypothetical protein